MTPSYDAINAALIKTGYVSQTRICVFVEQNNFLFHQSSRKPMNAYYAFCYRREAF